MRTMVRDGGAKALARNGAARKGRGDQKRNRASTLRESTRNRRQKGSDVVDRDRKAVKTALEHAVRGELDPALRAAGCRANSRLGGVLRDVVELSSAAPPEPEAATAAQARTMVPLADVVRATELLQLMHDNGDMDDNSCNCTDFAVFLYNKGNAEDRTEALLVLAPLADRLYDRLVEAESKD